MSGAPGELAVVLDIGKTNVKASVVTAEGAVLACETTPTPRLEHAPYAAFDVERIYEWFLSTLRAYAARYAIARLIPVTHGATCALLDGEGRLAAPVLDYEFGIPEPYASDYERARPLFAETLTPALPNGLNLGRQIYWLQRRDPQAFARVRQIMLYPQYWAWRFSGAFASEATSLGCHTDLWRPREGDFSSLAVDHGWAERMPEVLPAWTEVGPIRPGLAAATGLPRGCVVHVGVHDTNAALYSILAEHEAGPAPAVLSTGTWFVAMNPGGPLDQLSAERDCLANVDVFGRATPSARFMGGRTYDAVFGGRMDIAAADEAIQALMARGAMALPNFLSAGGPFPGERGEMRGIDPNDAEARGLLGSIFLALISDVCLDLAGSRGAVVLEGPAAKNPVFRRVLAALREGPLLVRDEANGVTLGAGALAFRALARPSATTKTTVEPFAPGVARAYRDAWREAIDGRRLAQAS